MMLMRRKMMKPAVAVAALMMSSTALQADEINLYSVNTGSWIYHLSNNHGQYTEGLTTSLPPLSAGSPKIRRTACWPER
jgi:hypothetical protein